MPNAAGRRHKQALNNYSHLAPRQRPNYKRRDAQAAARHLQRLIDTERRIKGGGSKKK